MSVFVTVTLTTTFSTIIITVTSGQRILRRGRIAGKISSLGKFNVTLDYFCGWPIGMLVNSMRGNPDVRATSDGASGTRENPDLILLKSAPSHGGSRPLQRRSDGVYQYIYRPKISP